LLIKYIHFAENIDPRCPMQKKFDMMKRKIRNEGDKRYMEPLIKEMEKKVIEDISKDMSIKTAVLRELVGNKKLGRTGPIKA
jgi:hypothetical protein